MAVADINFTDFTKNVSTDADKAVTGDGVFDDMMETVNAHINAQYELGRITGPDYAQVYLGAIQAAMAESMKFVLQHQIAEEQTDGEAAKTALIKRQTQGFDDDAKQKLLKQQLDSWSVAYSVAKDAQSIPDAIKVNPIDSTLKSAFDALNISVTTDPLGE
jgi:hypothetical protein